MNKIVFFAIFFAIFFGSIYSVCGDIPPPGCPYCCKLDDTPSDVVFSINTTTSESKTYIDVNHSFIFQNETGIAINENFDIAIGSTDKLYWYDNIDINQWYGHKLTCTDGTYHCCNKSSSLWAGLYPICTEYTSIFYPVRNNHYDIYWCDIDGDSDFSDDIVLSAGACDNDAVAYQEQGIVYKWYWANHTTNNSWKIKQINNVLPDAWDNPGYKANSMYPFDYNNDGKTELAFSNITAMTLGFLEYNTATKKFVQHIIDTETTYGNITAADVDSNGYDDIIVEANYDNETVVVLYRNMGDSWIKCYIDIYYPGIPIDFNKGDLLPGIDEEFFVWNENIDALYVYELTSWNGTCPEFQKIMLWNSSSNVNMRFNVYDIDANGYGDIFGIFGDKPTLLMQTSELTFQASEIDEPNATFDDVAIIPYDNGTNCKLICIDNDYMIVQYDIFLPEGCVDIQGYTWNAINETLINSTDVSWKQNSTFWNASPSSGFYQVYDLNASCCSYLNTSNTEYNTYSTYFYPHVCGLYEVNAYMIPTNFSYADHAIAGVITQLPYQDSLANATVNISNNTWSSNTTTNSMGYYIFDNLSSGDYTINASKTGYFPEQDKTVHTGSYAIHNIMMSPEYHIKVEARDATTRAPINDWWLDIKEVGIDCIPTYGVSQIWNVSNWTINVTLPYGYFSFTGSHSDYYPNTTYHFVWQNDTLILYLDKVPVKYYPYHEHIVEFRVHDMYGKPYPNVRVTITPTESTLSSWDSIWEFFGITKKDVPTLNGSMSGTTDTGGRISFMMAEIIKYKVDFIKDSDNINETHYIYPKEFQYTIILIGAKSPTLYESVIWNLTAVDINASFTNLGLTYVDGLNETSNVYFYISDSNDNIVYQSNTSSSTVNEEYPIAHEKGVSYYWGFKAQHETFGEIKQDKVITFKCRLIDLELQNESYYTWISLGLLIFITTLFSAVTVKLGTIIVPFIGGFLNWIGWLSITPIIIASVIIIGVLLYIQKTEHDKRY